MYEVDEAEAEVGKSEQKEEQRLQSCQGRAWRGLSVRLPPCASVHLSVCLSVSIYLSIYLSISLTSFVYVCQATVITWLLPNLRLLLEWLCVGLLWVGLQLPHGLLLYMLSSASFAIVQHSAYGQSIIRAAAAPLLRLRPGGGPETTSEPDGAPQQYRCTPLTAVGSTIVSPVCTSSCSPHPHPTLSPIHLSLCRLHCVHSV